MAVLICLEALAVPPGWPNQDAHCGRYLQDLDQDSIRSTANPARARHFPDVTAAWECWKQQSRLAPMRPDGEPNRPLTAYSVSFQAAPEG